MFLSFVLACLNVHVALGAEPCAKDRVTLLACIDAQSPEVQAARLSVEKASAQERAAAQWQNPALGLSSLGGKGDDGQYSETEINLSAPLELGGKIQARRSVAEAETAARRAELYSTRVRLRVSSLVNLNRYRQAIHERENASEAVSSFERLVKQYSRRARLSPEQETSLAVYRMALNEYRLRSVALSNELTELATFFRVNAGLDQKELERLVPPPPENWPVISEGGDFSRAPRIQALSAGVRGAEAELTSARSLAWPTISVGPTARWQTQSGLRSTMWGFNIGLAVPLFNVNQAGKQAAAAGLQLGQTARDLGVVVEQNKRRQAEQVYQQSVELVRASISHAELEANHRRVDQNFDGGLVPSALIIEAHRGFVDLERSRNERELSALRALYEIYSIDGTVMEVSQ